MISIDRLDLGYGKKNVLSNISLNIEAGEIVAIVGESASGKSTLMQHLYNLNRQLISWCPQDVGLVPPLSVFHNIYAGTLSEHSFFYNLRNLIKPTSREFAKVSKVANQLNIEHALKTSVEQLSGGQQQRVNIARAMIQDNDIFLGDEPVSALDDFQKRQVISTITQQFTTCIFALHDLDLALNSCQRIIGIKDGKIAFDEQVNELSKSQLANIYSHHPHTLLTNSEG